MLRRHFKIYFLGTRDVNACKINKSQLTVASGERPPGEKGVGGRGDPREVLGGGSRQRHFLRPGSDPLRGPSVASGAVRRAGGVCKPGSRGPEPAHSCVSFGWSSAFVFEKLEMCTYNMCFPVFRSPHYSQLSASGLSL